jgi:aldose 1-epimerase
MRRSIGWSGHPLSMKQTAALAQPTSGRQLHLTAGDLTATVVQVGAGLRELAIAGRPVLDGYAQDEIAAYAQGQALVPWPNRLADGRYTFAGTDFQLPLTEPENHCAIHGLARWLAWDVVTAEEDRVALAVTVAAQAGYPFTMRAQVQYTLTGSGISVQTTLTNAGQTACPAGHGFHPYVTVGTDRIDDTRLHLPAASRLEADDRGIPTGRRIPVAGTEYDFREPRLIGDLQLDTAFTDLLRDDDGLMRIRLAAPGDSRHADLWLDGSYDFVMAFTADSLPDPARRRRALGLEPMTCAPNAFSSGDGLQTLQPGEATTSRWGLRPS